MRDRETSRLIEHLAAEARPVSPLWPPALRALAWVIAAATLLGLLTTSHLRPDLAVHLRRWRYLLELGSIVGLTTAVAHLAALAAVPGREASRAVAAVTILAAAVVAGFAFLHPMDLAQSLAGFTRVGLDCLRHTMLLALVPTALMLLAIRRGAPLAPATAGALAGVAGWLLAYLFVRLTCPLDETLHIWLWHLGPIGPAAAIMAALGAFWLGRWRREGDPRPR